MRRILSAVIPAILHSGCRRIVLFGLLAVAVPALADDGRIHRSAAADPPSLDPTLGSGTPAGPILSDLVEGLIIRDRRSQPAPGSAVSWSVSDDGSTWTFRLRDDLRWSDGRPLTADDFVWSYRRLLDPATASPAAGLFFAFENARAVFRGEQPVETLGVAAPDPATVVIRLENPAPWFPQLLANSQAVPVPRHVIEEHGRAWARPDRMVTNGPYRLAERVPQSHVRLVRNSQHHAADEISIDEVWWYPTQDLGAAIRRFRAGELDVVLNVPADQLGWIERNRPEALHTGPIKATWLLLLNPAEPPLDDMRVRQALSLAVDRQTIAGDVLGTGVRPAGSFVAPDFDHYPQVMTDGLEAEREYRLERARELLAGAGYGPANPLEVTVRYDSHDENRQIMIAITSMWRAIGVRVRLEDIELSALMRSVRTGDFQIARSQTFALFDDPFAFLQQYRSDSPTNWVGWRDADYDHLLEQSNRIVDPVARGEVLAEAEQRLLDAHVLLPVYHYVGKVLVGPRVEGWYNAPLGTTPSRYLKLRKSGEPASSDVPARTSGGTGTMN